MTIRLAEQNAFEALQASARAYVRELGRVRLEGTSQRLVDSPEVRHHHLGVGLP